MSFRPAVLEGQSIPPAVELDLAAAQDFLPGALLLRDGGGDFAECGADPASIGAVAVTGGGADTEGFRLPAKREFPPDRVQAFPIKDDHTRWSARWVGTLPAAVGGAFGVIKDTDGEWKVDFADVVATRVTLVSLEGTAAPLSHKRVIVTFLEANIQAI